MASGRYMRLAHAAEGGMSRDSRETSRIRWPRNATERAMQAVLLRWHLVGCLKLLRSAGP